MGIDKTEQRAKAPRAHQTAPHQAPAAPPTQQLSDAVCDAGQDALAALCDQVEQAAGVEDDATFRLSPGNDGQSWYITCTWRSGRWRGHYVMAVVHRGELALGLALLARKALAVRRGQLTPTRDAKWKWD